MEKPRSLRPHPHPTQCHVIIRAKDCSVRSEHLGSYAITHAYFRRRFSYASPRIARLMIFVFVAIARAARPVSNTSCPSNPTQQQSMSKPLRISAWVRVRLSDSNCYAHERSNVRVTSTDICRAARSDTGWPCRRPWCRIDGILSVAVTNNVITSGGSECERAFPPRQRSPSTSCGRRHEGIILLWLRLNHACIWRRGLPESIVTVLGVLQIAKH